MLFRSVSALTAFFYNDPYYGFGVVFQTATVHSLANTSYEVFGFIFQAIHGALMFILPTSPMLVGGLMLAKVDYRDWLKYIIKYALQVLVLIILFTLLFTLFI